MYKHFQLHGDTMRFAPYRNEGGITPNKVVKIECIKQIHFEYKESTKREYVNITLNFAEDGSVILPDEDKEIVSTITEKYRRLNSSSNHWDDGSIEFTMENTHRHKELHNEIKTISKVTNEPLWNVVMKVSRNDITCDVIGSINITFLNGDNTVLGVQAIQRNINDIPVSVVRTKIEEIHAEVYSDIDLFFGVNDITNNEECYVKDEDTFVPNQKGVNVLWSIGAIK